MLAITGTDGAFFNAIDGSNRYGPLFMGTGEVRFLVATGVETVAVPDISQFHIYRVETEGNSAAFNFYVDGELLLSGIAEPITWNGFDPVHPDAVGGLGADNVIESRPVEVANNQDVGGSTAQK